MSRGQEVGGQELGIAQGECQKFPEEPSVGDLGYAGGNQVFPHGGS